MTTGATGGYRLAKAAVAVLFVVFVAWRLNGVLAAGVYGPDTWLRFAISGLIIGAVSAILFNLAVVLVGGLKIEME